MNEIAFVAGFLLLVAAFVAGFLLLVALVKFIREWK